MNPFLESISQRKPLAPLNPRFTVLKPKTLYLLNNSSISFTIPETFQTKIMELEKEGKTVVTVFVEEKLIRLIAVADTIRDNQYK